MVSAFSQAALVELSEPLNNFVRVIWRQILHPWHGSNLFTVVPYVGPPRLPSAPSFSFFDFDHHFCFPQLPGRRHAHRQHFLRAFQGGSRLCGLFFHEESFTEPIRERFMTIKLSRTLLPPFRGRAYRESMIDWFALILVKLSRVTFTAMKVCP